MLSNIFKSLRKTLLCLWFNKDNNLYVETGEIWIKTVR